MIRNELGQFKLTEGKTDWRTINFYEDYVPYYELHTRDDTCNYFDINRDIHEMLLKEFNYSKPINNIVKLAARNFLFNEINFDSKPELAFYIYYIEHNISIKHEPCQIEYLYENETHYYIPDFMLQEQLIEIKGEHFFNSDGSMCNPYDHSQDSKYEAKHQCMLMNNVKILKSKDCKFAIDYCINKYGKTWYEPYYRKEK